MSLIEKIQPYSKAVVRLLKGTVNKKDSIWEDTLLYKKEITEYISVIGLELIIQEEDGYAFVKQFIIDEDDNTLGLVSRRAIGFEVSVVLVILRQMLEEFENNPIEIQGTTKYILKEDLKVEIERFLPQKYNTVQFLKDLDSHINKIIELRYLKEVSENDEEPKYIIHKIIKDKVSLDILNDFKNQLEAYVESI